jgi:hypothetical protein
VSDTDIPEGTIALAADDVVFASDTLVTGIDWSGLYSGGGTGGDYTPSIADSFHIKIYADAGGIPGSTLATFSAGDGSRVDSGFNLGASPYNVYSYEASLSYTFLAGVTYWVSVQNSYGGDTDLWGWGRGNPGTGSAIAVTNAVGDWHTVPLHKGADFRLYGEVPAPTTLALLSISGLAASRRRR